MVKQSKTFLLFALVGATLVGCGSVNSSPFVESTTDLLSNDKGIRFAADAESFVGSDEVVAYSPTYAQYGTNPETGNKVLRFATAVKGAIESISYTRAPIGDETEAHVKEVYTLYAGIMASGENQYYTSEGLSQSEEDKGQYYWACYSIEYTDSAYYGRDVDVTFSVDGGVVNTKQANLQNMIDVDTKLYKSIYIDGDVNVQHGQNINTAELVVKAINHDGTEITLDPADYSITNSKVASFGESATVEIVHNQDSSLTATKEVITTRRVEGESGKIVGEKAKAVTETEYTLVDGNFVEGGKVGAAGGFSGAVNKGKEGSLTLTYVSKTDHVGGLTMRVSNSNLAKGETYYYMNPLQLNSIVDISLNGENLDLSDEVVIPGTPQYTAEVAYAPLYNIYHLVSLDNIQFKAGINTFKFNFKLSTLNEVNHWEESPSEFNVDYVDFYSTGSVVDEIDFEAGLTLDEASFTTPAYGTKISVLTDSSLVAIATTKSGVKVAFERDELNVTLTGGDHSYMVGTEEYIVFGEHTLAFNLVENEEISGTYTFNVKEEENTGVGITRVQSASLEVVNNRVYYVIRGTSRGVKPGDAEVFDGSNVYPSEWTFGLNTYECRVDITDFAGSSGDGAVAFWPHFRVNGKNWDGKNGDVKLAPSSYNNTIVYCNNKRFQLCGDSYDMPVVYVGTLDYSDKDAVITDTSVVQEDGKVYYQLTGYAYNVSLDKIVLKELASSTRTVVTDSGNPFKFIFKYDVTNRTAADGDVWPHITINGAVYAGGGTAGDLKGQHRATANGIKIGTSSNTAKVFGNPISANGKTYKIFVQYGMPVLNIA